MYKTSTQNLTLDRILGKSKENKFKAKHTAKDKQQAQAVLARLSIPTGLNL